MSRYARSFICLATFTLVVTGALALHTVLLGGKNYLVPSERSNWYGALDYCKGKDMHLLTIESAEESNRVMAYLNSTFPKGETFWTAGNDLAEVKKWIWATTGKPIKYTNWAVDEPNNWNIENERCIEVKFGQWNDRSCASELPFVCQDRVAAQMASDRAASDRAATLSSTTKGLWVLFTLVLYVSAKHMYK